ncbi:hypothetical protein ACN38_g13075, partial [Penicillium nordicum]
WAFFLIMIFIRETIPFITTNIHILNH